MAQPPAYSPADFTSKEWNENRLADLDSEWAKIQAHTDAVGTNLEAIQRDDTKLANGSVHKDALAAETLTLFAASWNPRGEWATTTAYEKRDAVTESGNVYLCLEDHTSGTFATDLAADKWMFAGAENVYATDAEVAAAYNSEVSAASQSEMETGTETAIRRLSPLRVWQAINERLTQAINMAGAVLRGHCASGVALTAATDLDNSTHRAAVIDLANNTLTIVANASTAYSDGHQSMVWSSHTSGGTVTAAAGVDLNGVTAGSATVNEGEAYGLYREAADTWWLFNATVS